MIYVISKATFGSYNVRDIQCNANWDCCPYSDYALIPDSMVEGILATKGYCDITLNSAGTEVTGFTARTIPSVPDECCGTNTVLSVNGKTANTAGEVSITASDVGAFSTDELIPLSNGGTNRDLSGVTPYAIIRAASNSTALLSTPTANGAFYATAANGAAKFGTLPIAQGGTGATTAAAALIALGAASATPSFGSVTNGTHHYFYFTKIGKLVICTFTQKTLATETYGETITIPTGFIPSANRSFNIYSDTAHWQASGSNVSNGGNITVKASTNGKLSINEGGGYNYSTKEIQATIWWVTA